MISIIFERNDCVHESKMTCEMVCGVQPACCNVHLMIKHPFWDGHYQFHRKSKVSGEQKYVFLKDAWDGRHLSVKGKFDRDKT